MYRPNFYRIGWVILVGSLFWEENKSWILGVVMVGICWCQSLIPLWMVISSTLSKETTLAKDPLSPFLLLAFPIPFRASQTLSFEAAYQCYWSSISRWLESKDCCKYFRWLKFLSYGIFFKESLHFLILLPYLLILWPLKVPFSLTMSLGWKHGSASPIKIRHQKKISQHIL